MAILFDLDLTLIDSEPVAELRRQRRWTEVYQAIPRLKAYPGIDRLLQRLNVHHIPVCVVTSSPRPYCQRILAHHQWPVTHTICYHDTQQHKPHPAPLHAALERLDCHHTQAIAIGDDPNDCIAAQRAQITCVGALWGSKDPKAFGRPIQIGSVRRLTQ
jgi:HAD superfamily hydrolase (TIGR01549 family)